MTLALDVRDLVKTYGRHRAVDAATFSVRAGELACLIGPNGAGKSTLMRTIAGLQVRDSGTVAIAGEEVVSAGSAKALCALTPQDLDLFEHLSGDETLRMVAAVRGVEPATASARIERWFDVTRLAPHRDRLVREYSGGMKRKLAVATAMIGEPSLVLLDESFTGLDPESTRALQVELRAYCDRGGAILLSSHILDMVQAIADRVVVLSAGRVVDSLDRAALAERIPAAYADLTDLYLDRAAVSP